MYLKNENILPTAVSVSMEMDEYSVIEGSGAVEVCALLMVAPAGSLECSIVAILTTTDGDKAGMPITPICMFILLCRNYLTQYYLYYPALGSDFGASEPLEVTFMVGAMQSDTSCANITIIDDASFESDHSFSVNVTSVELESGGTDAILSIGVPSYATIYIEDNDRE